MTPEEYLIRHNVDHIAKNKDGKITVFVGDAPWLSAHGIWMCRHDDQPHEVRHHTKYAQEENSPVQWPGEGPAIISRDDVKTDADKLAQTYDLYAAAAVIGLTSLFHDGGQVHQFAQWSHDMAALMLAKRPTDEEIEKMVGGGK